MSNRSTTSRHRLDSALSSLDAAQPVTGAQRLAANAVLDRIVTTEPDATVRRPRHRRILLAAAAGVAAVGAAVALWPGGGGVAYASWTPVPTALTETELQLIGPECRDALDDSPHLDMARANLVLSERRGEYAMLLYRTENPDMAGSCLVHNVPGSDDVDDVKAGAAGGSGPAQVVTGDQFTQGAIADFIDASVTDGAVGDDVAAVTIHAGEFTAEASVHNGRYVVWWPGQAFDRTAQGDLDLIITYDLTLKDGTVVTNAEPTLPS
ncbi:hypothetical protein [Actinoplanes couchii]|uniref:Uncharacterized protein n=1 Tax=Actinoplanes couchii TaxID=403638 RepID=A0ABQ3XHJ7_9ACTN|nr:hypothetical protein [Actinoplanes couchii]MDR6317588.1 hypothetical protein [Actinoplanes couchii]GID57972.1 hypothetical protein Aco03nite_063760 [Actinoplanes couchii]